MSQSTRMNAALIKYVIHPLLALGFTGEFPHYRKTYDDRTELLSIMQNQWGNSFTIEVSTIYPSRTGAGTNFANRKENLDDVNVWDTDLRYRLRGMF